MIDSLENLYSSLEEVLAKHGAFFSEKPEISITQERCVFDMSIETGFDALQFATHTVYPFEIVLKIKAHTIGDLSSLRKDGDDRRMLQELHRTKKSF